MPISQLGRLGLEEVRGWEVRGWFGAGIWAGLAPLSLALQPAACRWGEHPLGWG